MDDKSKLISSSFTWFLKAWVLILIQAACVKAQTPDTWVKMSDMPGGAAARDRAVSFELGGLGYVGLGSDGVSTFYQSFWAYNPATDSWTQKATFNLASGARNRSFSFALNGYGYFGTGWNGSIYLQGVFQYDPVANSWSQKGNFPGGARLGATAFVIGQRAYVVGGDNGPTTYDDVWEYDAVNDSWTQRANIPQSRYSSVSFTIGNYGYVTTGYSGAFLKDCWRYDPASNTWLRRADIPSTPRSLATAFAIGSSGFIYGGSSTGGILQDLWEYSPYADKWFPKTIPPMGQRFGCTQFVINDTVYVGTGNNNANVFKDLWKYYPLRHQSAQFQKNFGGTGDDTSPERICFGEINTDDGYIISSSSKSFSPNSEIYLIRLTPAGDTIWTRLYGTPGEDIASSVTQTYDKGFVVGGMTGPSYNNADALLLKANLAGTLLWNGNLSGAGVQRINCVKEVANGELIAAGRADGSQQNAAILKLSSAGGTLVGKYINHNPTGNTLEVYSVVPSISNGYIFGGEYISGGNADGMMLFSDENIGSGLSMGNYGTLFAEDRSIAIENYDGTLMLCGTSSVTTGHGGRDVFLAKISAGGGSVLWTKFYGGSGDDMAKSIVQTSDGGYAIAGFTNSIGSGGLDAFLMKIDSSGNPVWNRTYGGSADEKCGAITLNYDGGFTLFGETKSFTSGGTDVYCIRTDSLGFSGCHETSQNFLTPIGTPNLTPATRATVFSNFNIVGGPPVNVKPVPSNMNNICFSCTATAQSNAVDALCFGGCTGSATVTPTSPGNTFTYSWTPGSFTTSVVTGLCAGNYTVQVTDDNSCTATTTLTVSQPAALTVASANDTIDICIGNTGTISVAASGGVPPYSYSWSPATGLSCTSCPNPIASPTSGTSYIVTITDSNKCVTVDSVQVEVHAVTNVSAGTDQTICVGDSVAVGGPGIGGVNYSWSPPTGLNNTTASNPTAGPASTSTYVVTATNAQSCSASDTVIVTVAPSPTVNISASGSTTICLGDSLLLSATAGSTQYQWSTGQTTSSILVTPSASTSYTVDAGIGTCLDSDSIDIVVVTAPVATIANSSSGTICAGTSITLSAPGPGNYLWNTGETTSSIAVTYPSAGSFINSVTVTVGGSGCSAQDSIAINVVSSPAISVTASSYTLCAGLATDTLIATNINGGSYNWQPGIHPNNDTIVIGPGLSTGVHIYTVTVNNGNGCSGVSTTTINVSPGLPIPVITPAPGSSCFGDPVPTFTCTNVAAFVGWFDMQGNALGIGATFTPTVSATGAYTFICVQATDKNCVSNPATAVLNINPLPVADAGADVSVCPGHTAQLNAGGGSAYQWSPVQGLSSATINNPSANPDSTISYEVMVTDLNGCKDRDSITVFIVMSDDCGIHVYNVVTPNYDGDNDNWWIDGIDLYPENKVKIFNRWGNLVWQANAYDNKNVVWYGQNEQGDQLPAGTYYYTITINGRTYTNFVELIR